MDTEWCECGALREDMEISATLIKCSKCSREFGLVNGAWIEVFKLPPMQVEAIAGMIELPPAPTEALKRAMRNRPKA